MSDNTSILQSDQLRVGGLLRRASPPRDDNASDTSDSMPLKVLNCSLVFLGCRLCLEGSQIRALSSFRIFLL